MKTKTIGKNIERKIKDWIGSLPKSIQHIVHKDTIVTGGCITSMYHQEPVNDYDIYLKTYETSKLLAEYYAGIMRRLGNDIKVNTRENNGSKYISMEVVSSGVAQGGTTKKYEPIFLSPNAITLNGKIQIITRFNGDENAIHKNFDFVHATNYWTLEEGIVTNKKALESILSREIIYQGSLYPLASILRTRKFIQRGWSCHVSNYLKMAFQLNELDLFNIETLKDQLVGVDLSYMDGLTRTVSGDLELDQGFKIDSSYLCDVVDKMIQVEERG